MRRPSYRRPCALTAVGASISVTCLTALVILWGLIGSADASVWTESADQVLTWLDIEHQIGSGDGGISVWIWVLSAFLGAASGFGLLLLTVGLCWLLVVFIRDPKVKETTVEGLDKGQTLSKQGIEKSRSWSRDRTQQSAVKSRQWSKQGIEKSRDLSNKGLKQGQKLSEQLKARYRERNKKP